MALSCPGEGREEEAHAEGIVNVTESINEGGIPATRNKKRDDGEEQGEKKRERGSEFVLWMMKINLKVFLS